MRMICLLTLALVAACAATTYQDLGLIPFNGGQYLLSSFNSTWVDGSKFCKNIGYALLDVETAEENDHVLSVFGAAIPDRVWIGGSDLGMTQGLYYWGQTWQPFNATFWHAGEPTGTNLSGVKENCVHYRNIDSTIMWNDAPCEFQYQFICEVITSSC